jgi:hypothetical protein
MRTREHFRNPSCAKLVIAWPNYDNLVESAKFVEIHRKVVELGSDVFTNFLLHTLNIIITHNRWPTTRFYRETLFAHLRTFYNIALQFLHSLHFGRKPSRIIHDGFPQHSCF